MIFWIVTRVSARDYTVSFKEKTTTLYNQHCSSNLLKLNHPGIVWNIYQEKNICNSDEFVHRKDLTTGADIFHTMIAKKGDANEGGTDFAGQNYFFLPAIDIPLNVLMLFLMSFSRAHRENWMRTFAPYFKKTVQLKKNSAYILPIWKNNLLKVRIIFDFHMNMIWFKSR